MPHSVSAKKRLRQNLRNRERNRAVKSDLKVAIRKVLQAVTAGDGTLANEQLRTVAKKADRAAAARTIHPNRAARIKSRLSSRIRAVVKGEAAPKAEGKTGGKGKTSAAKAGAGKSSGAKSAGSKSAGGSKS
jgi:small subunit ribosomal protein S20